MKKSTLKLILKGMLLGITIIILGVTLMIFESVLESPKLLLILFINSIFVIACKLFISKREFITLIQGKAFIDKKF